MVKRSFKMGGNGRTVAVVPDVDSDASTMPAVGDDTVTEFANSLTSVEVALEQGALATMGDADVQGAGVEVCDANHFGALADAMEANHEAHAGAPGDVFGTASVADRVALYRAIGDATIVPEGWRVAGGPTDQGSDAMTGLAGSVVADGLGAVVDVLACEPDVVNVLQALRADDDGMGLMLAVEAPIGEEAAYEMPGAVVMTDAMLATMLGDVAELESVVVTDVFPSLAEPELIAGVTDAVLDVVACEPATVELSPIAALVAAYQPNTVQPVTMGDDYVVCTPRMDIEMARFMAQAVADKTGMAVKVAYAGVDFGRGGEPFFPGSGGKRSASVARVSSAARSTGGGVTAERAPAAAKAERDWLTYDARVEGGKYSNPKLWQRITDAAEVCDLDMLQAFDFAGSRDDGSGNTQAQSNGKYLRAQIARVTAILAEREAAKLENEARIAALEASWFTDLKLAAD